MHNKLSTKVNNLEKKNPDAITLIHLNQYNKWSLVKKSGNDDEKIPDVIGLLTITVRNTKVCEVENKMWDTIGYLWLLVTTTVLNTKIRDIENKIPDVSGLVKLEILKFTK